MASAGYNRWQPVRVNRHSLQESINIINNYYYADLLYSLSRMAYIAIDE